jgi:hypothetical protein
MVRLVQFRKENSGGLIMWFVMIPVAALMAHSLFTLSVKYRNHDNIPLWLKAYLIMGIIFIVGSPSYFVYNLLDWMKVDVMFSVGISAIVGSIVLFAFILMLATIKKDRPVPRD